MAETYEFEPGAAFGRPAIAWLERHFPLQRNHFVDSVPAVLRTYASVRFPR